MSKQFAKSVSDSEPNTTQFIWPICPIGQNIWDILKKAFITSPLSMSRAINKAFSANTNCNLTGFSFGHLGSLLKMADAISCTKVGLKFWPGKRPVSPLCLSYIRPGKTYGDSGYLMSNALAIYGLAALVWSHHSIYATSVKDKH